MGMLNRIMENQGMFGSEVGSMSEQLKECDDSSFRRINDGHSCSKCVEYKSGSVWSV